jgi:hypothetical protein
LREANLFFWRRAEKSSSAEVDYLYEKDQIVIPVEIKSGHAGSLKSLHLFLGERPNSTYGIRFSAQNESIFQNIDSRPLYAIATLAHEDQKPGLRALDQS